MEKEGERRNEVREQKVCVEILKGSDVRIGDRGLQVCQLSQEGAS